MADTPPPSKILRTFKKHLKDGEAVAGPIRKNAQLNERFCAGKQWGVLTANGVIDDLWYDDEKVPRTYVNLCQGLMTTFSALLNKDRKSALATPLTPDEPEDVYVAEICNRFIDFFSTEQKTADKIHQAVQFAFQGGSAGMKVWYDAHKDEIRWSRLTVHDFVFDPNHEDWRDAQWCIFESRYDEDTVTALWEASGIQSSPPKEEEYVNAAGQRVSGIKGYEYWHRPGGAYPDDGLYACIIGDEVVERRAYPIAVPTDGDRVEHLLPFVLMKIRQDRESPYGITPLTDVINLQRQVNEVEARIQKLVRIVTHPQLKVPKSLENIDITTINIIAVDETKENTKIEWTSPGTIDQNLFRTRDDKIAQMTEVVGLNAITTGANTTTQSGRAIEARYEIDAQKNSDALKSLDDMVLDGWRLTLALVQLHYNVKRQSKIVRQDAVDLVSFSAADIMGSNIRLESASEIARRTDVRTADAVEKAQAGAGSASDVAAAMKTAPNAIAQKQARRAVQQFLAGDDIDTEALSKPALLSSIDREKSRALSTSNRSDFSALMLLERLLREQGDEPADDDALPPSSGTSGTQAAPSDTITSPEIQA